MIYRRFILIFSLFFASFSMAQAGDSPVAKDGVLDLRSYDFFEEGVISIEGEWRFFWEEIIDPSLHSDSTGYIVSVPSSWKQLEDIVPGIESRGFASYNLKILLPENIHRVAFRFTEVFSGSGYYVNGKNIGFNGFPGANSYQNLFETRPSLHTASPNGSIIDLVIHVSNFHFRTGGMKGEIDLGIPMQIMNERANRQLRDSFLFGAFLIIGIFFLGMYFIHAELHKLFFSLICLLFAFRLILISESDYFDWITGVLHMRLEYISFGLMVPMFMMMIRYLFLNDFPKLFLKIVLWVCLLMIIILVVSPINFFSEALVYYYIIVALSALVILYVMFKAIRRGRRYVWAYTIGVIVVIASFLNDILIVSDIIETSYKAQYGMFIYATIFATIFSLESNNVLRHSEQLSLEISEVNENLESIVEERTHELHQKSEELLKQQEEIEERNRELNQLIAVRNRFFTIIGHDIRGPVGYTTQTVELLLRDDVAEDDKKELLTLLMKSSKATMNLLENLMVWGRAQIGNLVPKKEDFNLLPLIDETIELFDHALLEKSIKIHKTIGPSIQVKADKEQTKMIIRNLISNAVKFTGRNGIIKLSADASENAKEVVFEVSDSGIGIPSVVLEKLFSTEEFYTTHGTNSEKGSGLGLKLCYELITLNDGWIKVESKTGKGTTFSVGLPA